MLNQNPIKERGLRELVFCVPPMVYIYRFTVEGFKLVRTLHGVSNPTN